MNSAVLDPSIEAAFLPLLERVEQRFHKIALTHSRVIGDLASHIIKAGGKRLRPLLVILSGWREDANWEAVIDVAVAAEMLHTASLIHDDIIDHADTRRGVPTINKIQGNHSAVITGDYLFARAITLLSQQGTSSALPLMMESIQSMCEGIIEETASLFDHRVTEQDYLSRIDKKTAALVAACCGGGALVSGAPREEVSAMINFGRYLGLSYQIVDDILDFISDEAALGKPANCDLSQGILTLPVIYLLEYPEYREQIKEMLARRSFTDTDIEYIKKAAQRSSAISRAYKKAQQFQQMAQTCLEILPLTPVKTIFNNISDMVISRNN